MVEALQANIVEISKSYVLSLLDEIPGIKALILDSETTNIVSLVCPKSMLLSREVFLIETIENIPDHGLQYMKGVFLLRATEENKNRLLKLLKSPVFSEYYLYFTNVPFTISPQTILQELAIVDEKSVVKSVQVLFS